MQKMEASPFFDVFCVNGLLLNTTKFGNEMLVSGSKIPTCEEVMAISILFKFCRIHGHSSPASTCGCYKRIPSIVG